MTVPREDHEMQQRLLLAAQAGDEHAFRRLVELQQPVIQAHCYRMLGSRQDAEDAYQDTLLRAWRALEDFDGDSRLATWLYRIATNVCLSALTRAQRRVLPSELQPPTTPQSEPAASDLTVRWLGPFPDAVLEIPSGYAEPGARFEQRESIELAFVAALQLLPPRQRAALILSEVLGFRATEIAATLSTTVASVTSLLQRARARLDTVRPVESQQRVARALGGPRLDALVDRFIDALEDGDTAALLDLLTEDVTFEMPPRREWARGRPQVAQSWLIPAERPTGLRVIATQVSGQRAVAVYRWDAPSTRHLPAALDVLTFRGGRIARVVAFRAPEAFATFGLPAGLPQGARHPPTTRGER